MVVLPDDEKPVVGQRPVLLAEVLDALPERVARYRLADRIIVYCNAAWAHGHGVIPQDRIGRPLDDLLTPPELRGMHDSIALAPRHP